MSDLPPPSPPSPPSADTGGADAGSPPVVSRYTERTFELDFGDRTALVEVLLDSLTVYVPRAEGAPPSPVEGTEHFAALSRDDDGTATRLGRSLATIDGEVRWVDIIDDDGFAFAERALQAWDAEPLSQLRFISARRSVLNRELEDALAARSATAAALEEASRIHDEQKARVAALRAAVLELDGSAPTSL